MRPKKDPIQKIIDKAGTSYWRWQDLLEKNEDDQQFERQGNKKMGRPPVPLPVLRQRAESEYFTLLSELRMAELAEGRVPILEEELIANGERLILNGPGRPVISDTGRKFRHLRRKLKTLSDAMATIDQVADLVYDGIGRPAMSSRERIRYYEQEIDMVRRDIEQTMAEASPFERIKITLDNARIDLRDASMKLKKAEENGAEDEAATLRCLHERLGAEVESLVRQLDEERRAIDSFVVTASVKAISDMAPSSLLESSPGIQAVIARLETQLIVPKLPTALTRETLVSYQHEVLLAKEFNKSIVDQIQTMRTLVLEKATCS